MAEAGEQKVPGRSKKLIAWGVVGLLVVLVAGDLTIRGLAYFKGPKAEAASAAAAKTPGPEHAKKPEVKATAALEPFLVNLADRDSLRFVKTTLQLGMETAKAAEEFSGDNAVVAATRDLIISLLGSVTAEQILSAEGKNKLRSEIKSKVNALSPEVRVVEVYIVDFVVQF